jgi:hypothetical protein
VVHLQCHSQQRQDGLRQWELFSLEGEAVAHGGGTMDLVDQLLAILAGPDPRRIP